MKLKTWHKKLLKKIADKIIIIIFIFNYKPFFKKFKKYCSCSLGGRFDGGRWSEL
jgi:hypothetical protein